jgi:hypothetical protein
MEHTGFFLSNKNANVLLQSVPPVWSAVKLLWNWVDENMNDLSSMVNWHEDEPLQDRAAWWEDMTTFLASQVGWMSLT